MKLASTLIAVALLSGCAAPAPLTAEQMEQRRAHICNSSEQCKVMWQKAQLWVAKNSGWKIQLSNDVIIQTFGPGDSTNVAYTITKEPLSQDTYKIVMEASCGNMFGCVPKSPTERLIEFNSYLKQ